MLGISSLFEVFRKSINFGYLRNNFVYEIYENISYFVNCFSEIFVAAKIKRNFQETLKVPKYFIVFKNGSCYQSS